MSKITEEFVEASLRNGVIIRPQANHSVEPRILHAAIVEMANLGFIVEIKDLQGMNTKDIEQMLKSARTLIGADRNMRPIYPGFPEQVQNLDTATLLFEQILHYWTYGVFLPEHPEVVREGLPLEDMLYHARTLRVLTASDAAKNFINILPMKNIALNPVDRELLNGSVVLAYPSLDEAAKILKKARNGENMQVFMECLKKNAPSTITINEFLTKFTDSCYNADQLLRMILTFATVPDKKFDKDKYSKTINNLVDKNLSTARMITLSRPVRRLIVARLGEVTQGFNADELVAHIPLWRKVLRMIHPYDVVLSDVSKRAADIVHANIDYRTFNSLVEKAISDKDVDEAIRLLVQKPGNLLRRINTLLRLCVNVRQVDVLCDGIREVGSKAALTTIISSYNGVMSVNDKHDRVQRIAGFNNNMLSREDKENIDEEYVNKVLDALEIALVSALAEKDAPSGDIVGIDSTEPVALVQRDLSKSDRVLDRGTVISVDGEGDTLRLFSHWNNNQKSAGYIDLGAVILDDDFNRLAVITWNSWFSNEDGKSNRNWGTYSGDCLVAPGNSAVEFIDIDIPKLLESYTQAKYVAVSLQSWSGFKMVDVDMIAGAMLRSKPQSGEPFDAKTVVTAFKPTTEAFQAVPLVFDINSRDMVWIDSSSGSTQIGVSAASDNTVGNVVYDEIARPRLTMGKLAKLWAKAHNVPTSHFPVDKKEINKLLN